MSAGHGHHRHGEDDSPLTAIPVRRVLAVSVGVIILAALVGLVLFWPSGDSAIDREALGFGERVDATVIAAVLEPCSYDPESTCDVVSAEVTSGAAEGEIATLETSLDFVTTVSTLRIGDEIVLNFVPTTEIEGARFSFADYQRDTPLLALLVIFVLAVVALGRWRGFLALVGLAVSLGVLFAFILPALLRGESPVGVALTGAVLIAVAALFLAHGVNEQTAVSLLGTVASLVLTAALAWTFAGAANLTGLASEDSGTLFAFAPGLDFRGLLLAAIIIGSLGVLDDVTVTQTSAVWELHRADPTAGQRKIYTAAIRIGRDHIASTVNTLVLAYAAAALPLLLIFTQAGLGAGTVVTTETVSVEIVQTLVGSIGLVASVPITTALAAFVVTRSDR